MERRQQRQQCCLVSSCLKADDELFCSLSPSRCRPTSSILICCLLSRFKKPHRAKACPNSLSSSLGSTPLTPLIEGPAPDADPSKTWTSNSSSSRSSSALGQWVKKGWLSRSWSPSVSSSKAKRSCDLSLMLSVLGAPLAPIRVTSDLDLSIEGTPMGTSSAQYILQQYTAASGGPKLHQNAYALGKLKMMSMEFDNSMRVIKRPSSAQTGGFVLWQMNPDKWYLELEVGDRKVQAGCNGKLAWRYTPWSGAQASKWPLRPLRRALQGLDPRATASLFADARSVGENMINGENCFVLKLSADSEALKAWSGGSTEVIRHNLFGYFSQKTGFLIRIEDFLLTRIQPATGEDSIYWETTINSYLKDYRAVDGMMIAHSGHTVATLFTFGETSVNHSKTRMEETWIIDEVAFDIPGLSADCFIPPADLQSDSISKETLELAQDYKRGRTLNSLEAQSAKVAASEHGVSRIYL